MSDANWAGFEAYFDDFMLRNFAMASIKREDEFNTVWYAAEAEGAKRMLIQFVREMEGEAGKVDVE